jgi:hypothetical protein
MEQEKVWTPEEVQRNLINKMLYLENLITDAEMRCDAIRDMCAKKASYISCYLESAQKQTQEIESLCKQEREDIKEEVNFILKKMKGVSKILGGRPIKKKRW